MDRKRKRLERVEAAAAALPAPAGKESPYEAFYRQIYDGGYFRTDLRAWQDGHRWVTLFKFAMDEGRASSMVEFLETWGLLPPAEAAAFAARLEALPDPPPPPPLPTNNFTLPSRGNDPVARALEEDLLRALTIAAEKREAAEKRVPA